MRLVCVCVWKFLLNSDSDLSTRGLVWSGLDRGLARTLSFFLSAGGMGCWISVGSISGCGIIRVGFVCVGESGAFILVSGACSLAIGQLIAVDHSPLTLSVILFRERTAR